MTDHPLTTARDREPATRPAKSMHVLVVIDGLGYGGAEMLLPEFIRAAELAGIEVSVAYLREKDGSPAASRLRQLGVEPVGLRVGGLLHPASIRTVYRHIARVRPDLVHTHLGYSDYLAGLAAGALGVPSVSTIHVTRWSRQPRERVKLRLFDLARRWTSSRVIAVSDAARAVYLEQGWGPRDRVVTMHNCISGVAAAGAGRSVRAELGIASDELVVGMVSVLRPGKGHELAADAIVRVRERLPGARLVVVGDGESRSSVERAAASLGPAAVLTGHRDDVMAVLDSFDVLVLPSEHEAFPTVLLEAMAAGVPIVASAVGGIPEIVDDGVTGHLLRAPFSSDDLAATLLELLESPAERARMADAARRQFEAEFSLARWGSRLRSLYEDVLVGRPARAQRLARRLRRQPRRERGHGHARGRDSDSTPGRA